MNLLNSILYSLWLLTLFHRIKTAKSLNLVHLRQIGLRKENAGGMGCG